MYPFVFNPFGRNNTVNILDLVIPTDTLHILTNVTM